MKRFVCSIFSTVGLLAAFSLVFSPAKSAGDEGAKQAASQADGLSDALKRFGGFDLAEREAAWKSIAARSTKSDILTVREWAENLNRSTGGVDDGLRLRVLTWLHSRGSHSEALLNHLVSSANPLVREQSVALIWGARELAKRSDSASLKLLRQLVRDEDKSIRLVALAEIERFGSAEAALTALEVVKGGGADDAEVGKALDALLDRMQAKWEPVVLAGKRLLYPNPDGVDILMKKLGSEKAGTLAESELVHTATLARKNNVVGGALNAAGALGRMYDSTVERELLKVVKWVAASEQEFDGSLALMTAMLDTKKEFLAEHLSDLEALIAPDRSDLEQILGYRLLSTVDRAFNGGWKVARLEAKAMHNLLRAVPHQPRRIIIENLKQALPAFLKEPDRIVPNLTIESRRHLRREIMRTLAHTPQLARVAFPALFGEVERRTVDSDFCVELLLEAEKGAWPRSAFARYAGLLSNRLQIRSTAERHSRAFENELELTKEITQRIPDALRRRAAQARVAKLNDLRIEPPAPEVVKAGERVFARSCAQCHGMDGRGVPGEVPPLAGSIWVVGSKERLGQVILRGLEGPLTFGDRTYDAIMPAVGAKLSEEDLAAVMNYVRNSNGNLAEEVTGAEAAEILKRAGSASSRWEAKALLAEYPLEN